MFVLRLELEPNEDVAVTADQLPSPVLRKMLAPATAIRVCVGVRFGVPVLPYDQKSRTARTLDDDVTSTGPGDEDLKVPAILDEGEYWSTPKRFLRWPPSRYSTLSATVRNAGSSTVGSLETSRPPSAGCCVNCVFFVVTSCTVR